MDKLSLKTLKMISRNAKPTHEDDILSKLGMNAAQSLEYLADADYIEAILEPDGMYPDYQSGMLVPREKVTGYYKLKPRGREYLQLKPGNDFDKWITRISAIVGAVTGIASLLLHFI